MGQLEIVVVVGIALLYSAVMIWPAARICRRTGHSPWLALAAVLPLLNIALLWYIAFTPWASDGVAKIHEPSSKGAI